jgi:hypothetical protein
LLNYVAHLPIFHRRARFSRARRQLQAPSTKWHSEEVTMPALTAWSNFYIIVGSSAGALTGLTFVVITLVASARLADVSWGMGAFTTPTTVHFALVLLIAAIFSAPWTAAAQAAVALGLTGVGGVVYSAIVVQRLRRPGNYQPAGEDLVWYGAVPLAAYAVLAALAIALPVRPTFVLFGISAVSLLLLFLGIRNAWDLVTYITAEHINRTHEPGASSERESEHEGREMDGA